MSPRALAVGNGLRGPGQDVFPEEAKELGRNLGLDDEAILYKNEPIDDEAGASTSNWVEVGKYRARIDVAGAERSAGLIADQINEGSKSIVSFDPGVPVDSESRIKIRGSMWDVIQVHEVSDPLIQRVEVKEVVGDGS